MNSLFLGMFEAFQKHLSDNVSFLKGKKLLLAVSGGVDSMVMVDLFLKCNQEIAIAHCNFNLRGSESDEEEKSLKNYTGKNNIPFHAINFNTDAFAKDNKLSIQVAARQLRYAWFHEVMQKYNFDFVLTAHHADDNLETILINFSRGTGLEGLTGIPQQNGNIVRPLLPFSRHDIKEYAIENDVEWREDSSNASDKYLRNKIRHELVPVLKNLNPSFLNSFRETCDHLQQAQSMVEDASNLVYKQVVIEKEDKIIFQIAQLKRLQNYNAYLYHWLKDFGFTAWSDIFDLQNSQSGKQIFSKDFVLLKDREILILSKRPQISDQSYYIERNTKIISIPINLSFSSVDRIFETSNDCIFVDEGKLKFPLEIRKWNNGDYFYPFGMNGKKKVSKFFKDEKYSLTDKADAWILCSENEVVWIVGKRLNDRFKVTEKTENILQIKSTK